MAQKTITIDIPEGYDDLIFNKDTNKIEFIKKDSKPKSWEEYCEQVKYTECYTILYNSISSYKRISISEYNEFNTKEEAQAFAALGKLIQLHKSWIKDWKPNWKDYNSKYTIRGEFDAITIFVTDHKSGMLVFPTKDLCDEFLNTFRDLIEIAKPFL